jgi:hypothetical protein
MAKVLKKINDDDTIDVPNYVPNKEKGYQPDIIRSIMGGGSIIDEKDENSHFALNKIKKPKYSQGNKRNKSKHRNDSNLEPPPGELTGLKQKKKRVKFKSNFVEFVDLESYKEHNLKMCFMEGDQEIEPIEIDEETCKCWKKYCVIF